MVSDGPILPNRVVHVILSFTLPFSVSPASYQIHWWGYQKHISLEFGFDFFSYFRNVASREICFSFLFLKGYYDQVSECHFSVRVADLNQWFSKSSLPISRNSVTWKRERNADHWAPPRTNWMGSWGRGQATSVFTSCPGHPMNSKVWETMTWIITSQSQVRVDVTWELVEKAGSILIQ